LSKDQPVPRPVKKSEFAIYFLSRSAEKAWLNLVAVRRNDLVEAWEILTSFPLTPSSRCSPMRKHLAIVSYEGASYRRWQLKLSLTDGSRIWYFVVGQTVRVEKVFTSHPNQTKK
jgi:hypothetical protein